MKSRRIRWIRALCVMGLMFWASDSFSGMSIQGMSIQGMSIQGMSIQGMSIQGMSIQGMSIQGMSIQGMSIQGMSIQGMSIQGMSIQGIDRLRSPMAGVDLTGIGYGRVQAPSWNFHGIQPNDVAVAGPAGVPVWSPAQTTGSAFGYTDLAPPSGVQLQLSPSASDGDKAGTYIYVPGVSNLAGTFWNLAVSDSTGAKGSIPLYIADVSTDPTTNFYAKAPKNDDVYLYTVYYRHPATQQWMSMCPYDPATGKASAMAMPLDANDWESPTSRGKFTFACTASGVGSKCARIWGYKPWKQATENVWNGSGFPATTFSLKPLYDACVIAARADYCQDGQSYTKNGTYVDLFDTLDSFTSINPTGGLPYTPDSTAPNKTMLHEEYQVSALDIWGGAGTPFYALTEDEITAMSLPAADAAALRGLRRSGMQSSRYADLDPGRSCLAGRFMDRCDPREPYACYRDANMSANPYGAFISVNSPRHCEHDETVEGAPLDPMCNLCVTRVCSVDPTCCGDPGQGYYPGSLVWDAHCTQIRNNVCKSTPTGTVWPKGTAAQAAGSKPAVYLRGAIGSFEGLTGAGPYVAEGWACDPDFPGASVPIQISIGGPLGDPGTTLLTATADQPLANGWRETVAAECGNTVGSTTQPGRHGFRYQLPASANGKDVYIYGIDLDTPGAPFTLLRGGKKPVPTKTVTNPRSGIWSGWLETTSPTAGKHTFQAAALSGETYRVWVNGQYVAGNWPDPNPGAAGAFVQPTPKADLYMVPGARYAVRVEYQRLAALPTTSSFSLKWSLPATPTTFVTIPTTSLYPMAQGSGDGLRGNFFTSNDLSGTPIVAPKAGAVDYVWTAASSPVAGINVGSDFSARFEGAVMPPISGNYLFSLDTDDAFTIKIDDVSVTDASGRLPTSSAVGCTHDICRTGEAVSKTCDQGYYCAAEICKSDPACCASGWDANCVQEVSTICHMDCRQSAPVAVELRAGAKYKITVELRHLVDPFNTAPRGARMKLMWALQGGAREPIPAERLFSGSAAPAGKGVGVNVAYFTDTLTTEHFGRVETGLSFSGGALPTAIRATMICPGAGTAQCATGNDDLGAPALTVPTPIPPLLVDADSTGPRVSNPITLKGAGAVRGANVTISEGTTSYSPIAIAAAGDGGGAFSMLLPTLALGNHTLTLVQSGPGKTSPATTLKFVVVDPAVLPPPTVNAATLSASNGRLVLSGTAAANATVTISGAGGTQTVKANASGVWTVPSTALYALPSPGAYKLTITSSTGGSTTVTAKYVLPDLNVTQPFGADQPVSATFPVMGSSPLAKGKVVVADGDGRYFVERTQLGTIDASGNFNFNVGALDPGRHVLRIFQRLYETDGKTVNLDGEPIERSVIVKPAAPPATMVIMTPGENAPVGNVVPIYGEGGPSRTGLRYGVAIYQGTGVAPNVVWTRVGQTDLNDDGTFGGYDYTVTLSGAGKTQLGVALIVKSLSGGGATESDRGSAIRNVVIAPPPPTLTKPSPTVNPIVQSSTTLAVTGTGVTNAEITMFIDDKPFSMGTPLIVANGVAFSRSVTGVPKGVHTLCFAQTLDGQASAQTVKQTLKIGDVTPPVITVADPTKQPPETTSETGAAVDVVALRGIKATDNNGASFLTVTCDPPATTILPIGTTMIVCRAQDAAGNVATTSQPVRLVNSAGPTLTGNNLVVEATGPQGAAVPYQVTATGNVANCGPAGSGDIVPCSGWQPADTGLGFHVSSVAVDPKDGTVYANAYVDLGSLAGTLFRQGADGRWTKLPVPGPAMDPRDNIAFRLWSHRRLTIARAAVATDPSTLYIPTENGLLASTDGGLTATKILSGISVRAVRVDPANPKHIFAWNEVYKGGGPISLFETTDGGASWQMALDGLTIGDSPDLRYPHITDIVLDPTPARAGWAYMQVSPYTWGGYGYDFERVYRRKPGRPWERVFLPPASQKTTHFDDAGVAITPNGTLFAAALMSKDGGDSWAEVSGMVTWGLERVIVDWKTPGRIVGMAADGMKLSTNNGDSFTALSNDYFTVADMTADPVRPDVLYAPRQSGLVLSSTFGQTWSAVKADGTPAKVFTVLDVAPHPVDSQVAYVLSTDGFYRTGDGGASWQPRMKGIADPYHLDITLDPFNYQTMYMSSGFQLGTPAFVWTDRNGDDTVPWTTTSLPGYVAADPAFQNTFFSLVETGTGPSGARRGNVYKSTNGVVADYALNITGVEHSEYIQVFPDAARTVAVSYFLDGNSQGGTFAFSARDAQLAPAVTNVVPILTGAPIVPVFDNSDGQEVLYVSGEALGLPRDQLFRAPLADALATGNAAFKLYASQPGLDFVSLVIDRGGRGRVMSVLDDFGYLWQSDDAGLTWAQDKTSPRQLKRLWTSSVDGAIYANESDRNGGPTNAYMWRMLDVGDQTLWKRSADNLPPGAGIVRGDLRVQCTSGGRSFTPGSVFPIGTTKLTCTATDVFKKVGTLSPQLTIVVQDTKPPVISVTPPAPVNVTSTDPNVTVNVPFTVTAKDAVDGPVTPTCNAPAGNLFKVGVTTVVCTAADSGGRSASVSFPVTVTRNGVASGAPVLTVPASVTLEGNTKDGALLSTAVKNGITAKTAGGAALPAPTCTPAAASLFAVGTTMVSCTTTDAGITVTRSFPVTVTDKSGPVITPPSLGTIGAEGPAGAHVSFTVTATDVVDGCIQPSPSALPTGAPLPCSPAPPANSGTITCAPATGSMFAQGRTTVTCRANDKRGNISLKQFDVLVTDVNEPVVTVPGLVTVEAQDILGAYATFNVTATDVEDGPITPTCAPLSGSWFPFGDSTVSCQATDRNGNTGRATFTVRVLDMTPPELTVPTTTIVAEATTPAGAPVSYVVKAFDLVKSTVVPVCTRSTGNGTPVPVSPGAIFPLGLSTVTCTATDDSPYAAMKQFYVQVVDTKGPVLTLPTTRTVQADATGSAIVNYVATAKDLGVAVPVTCTPPTGSRFTFGTTVVTCVARDNVGNESRGSFNVVVRDAVAPVIATVTNKTAIATSTAGAVVTYTTPTATDAVDGVRPVTCMPASGATFPVNVSTVTCSSTDTAGNTGTKTFTVTVTYQTGGFMAPLLADGSAIIQRSVGSLDVAFQMTGASAPITNLTTASLTFAPVVNGVPGAFIPAPPVSGTGNLFTYDSTGSRYVFKMALGGIGDGFFRLHADLGDGVTREVDFSTVMKWTPLSLAADWTPGALNSNVPASALLDGVVYLRGGMAGTGTGRPFQMPVGQRPAATVTMPIIFNNAVKGTLQIESDGFAYLLGPGTPMSQFVSFEGLSYLVNNGATAMTLQNGWTNAGSPWRNPTGAISSGVVHLAGAITTAGTTAQAFTLPASMRPAADVYVPVNLCTPRKGRLLIQSTGAVSVFSEGGSNMIGCAVSLEGVTYPVTNTAAAGWTCLTPQNGWVAQPFSTRTTCVKAIDGLVRLSGAVQNTTGTNMTVFTLPSGFRPLKDAYVLLDNSGASTGHAYINTAGVVTLKSENGDANARALASFEGAAFSF